MLSLLEGTQPAILPEQEDMLNNVDEEDLRDKEIDEENLLDDVNVAEEGESQKNIQDVFDFDHRKRMLEESARRSPSEGSNKDAEAHQVDADIGQVDQVD